MAINHLHSSSDVQPSRVGHNHDSHEFILEISTVANHSQTNLRRQPKLTLPICSILHDKSYILYYLTCSAVRRLLLL
jgi:hypothetical protein